MNTFTEYILILTETLKASRLLVYFRSDKGGTNTNIVYLIYLYIKYIIC